MKKHQLNPTHDSLNITFICYRVLLNYITISSSLIMTNNITLLLQQRNLLKKLDGKPIWDCTSLELLGAVEDSIQLNLPVEDRISQLTNFIRFFESMREDSPENYPLQEVFFNTEKYKKKIDQVINFIQSKIDPLKPQLNKEPISYINFPLKESQKRDREMMCKALIKRLKDNEMISRHTDVDTFESVFLGNTDDFEKIDWIEKRKSLFYFSYTLVKQGKVEIPREFSKQHNNPLTEWGASHTKLSKWINDRVINCFLIQANPIAKKNISEYKREFTRDLEKEEKPNYITTINNIVSNL